MALVNPQIAMSYRPTVEYQPRNALAEYAQIQQIVGGQRQAEAAEMQLESLRRERDTLDQIRSAIVAKGGPADLDAAADAMIKSGNPDFMARGMSIRDSLNNQRAFEAYRRRREGAAAPGAAAAPAPVGDLVAPPITAPVGTVRDLAPGAAPGLERPLAGAAPVNALAGAPAAPTNINALLADYREVAGINTPAAQAEAKLLLEQIKSAQTGAVPPAEVKTMQMLGYPLTVEGYRQYRSAQMAPPQPRAPVAVLQGGRPVYVSPEQAVGQTPFTPASVQVLGMGPGREPPAPTITQIQDPTDPARMITIDARRYQGGGVGSPGVIGASGKAAPATAAALKQEQGASQAQDILDNLRFAYEDLNRQKAIPSTQRNALSNVLASIGATGVGQKTGQFFGTEAQTQRDIIASARNQLFAAVKNATGLSAQNLNSNVEFITWLNSLTDPAKSIEANREILANMEKFIASGGKYSAKGGGQTPAPAAAPAGGATGGWSVVR